MQITINSSETALSSIVNISEKMPLSTKNLWKTHFSHVYGDMKGQRAVDLELISKAINRTASDSICLDIVIALETYYFLVSNLIAFSSFQKNPSFFFRNLSTISTKDFRSLLNKLVSGNLMENEGIYGCGFEFEFDWLFDGALNKELVSLKQALSNLENIWDKDRLLIPGTDPFQIIHHSLFPKNLLHIAGQFYTPEWLTDLLLKKIAWSPDERLIDPYCGSGVFLIRALIHAVNHGVKPNDILKNLLGIDLNPIACSAARANIALYMGYNKLKYDSKIYLNIINADALAPAISKGEEKKEPQLGLFTNSIRVDGELLDNQKLKYGVTNTEFLKQLSKYGHDLSNWLLKLNSISERFENSSLSAANRRILEQLFVYSIKPADVLVTNPPWVGWEYISRPYRETITSAWCLYDLFKLKGLDAAFLKEDLSSLASMVAWDFYLKTKGRSAVVLRPAIMHSDLAARGMRRLSLTDNGTPLNLKHIYTFSNFRVFQEANTDASAWIVIKGEPTHFPIPVTDCAKKISKWNPNSFSRIDEVTDKFNEKSKYAWRTNPQDIESRWLITDSESINVLKQLQGTNEYVPRMGVFTGGANAVFYLDKLEYDRGNKTSKYRNIIARAKRTTISKNIILENDLVYTVLRGRDIKMWSGRPTSFLLCPHTRETRMYPIEENALKKSYPKAYDYLHSMRRLLNKRQGFAGWERIILEKYYYTLQRIGEYTFSKFKVCWKYIASEFTVCVIGTDNHSKPILPNDKVMFIPFDSEHAAYFICGILSSTPARNYINSSTSKRQISTNIIKSLSLPKFDPINKLHMDISRSCNLLHVFAKNNDHSQLIDTEKKLDLEVKKIFGL